MRPTAGGYRVAVVGSSSLLGKEVLTVLDERKFPVSRLVTFEEEEDELALPIVDLTESSQTMVADEDVREADLDFAFLAGGVSAGRPAFLQRALEAGDGQQPVESHRCAVIDLGGSFAASQGPYGPLLDRAGRMPVGFAPSSQKLIAAPHPAAIMISTLLLSLADLAPLKRAVAQVLMPASEIGARAIEELQKQTINLLSFQKAPQAVFGAQMAFNMLPRVGRGDRESLRHLEDRIRRELRQYLGDRAPFPALRLLQVPVFYSLALSLYVETIDRVPAERLRRALTGGRLQVRRLSEQAPSPVEVTGSSNILLDAITADGGQPDGIWIWATADNLRLAAENAVEIAESLIR